LALFLLLFKVEIERFVRFELFIIIKFIICKIKGLKTFKKFKKAIEFSKINKKFNGIKWHKIDLKQ